MTTHEYGTKERDAENNHGTCWVMQAAEFARYTGNAAVTRRLPRALQDGAAAQPDGRRRQLPARARRTKPYGYSLFKLDAMAMVCQILSTRQDNLWTFELPDGRGMRQALAFMCPVHPRQGEVAARARRQYWRRVADAATQPALRRPGA